MKIITADSLTMKVIQIAKNVAASRATVLITGESGTGKELLARLIHENSPRANRKMIAINCAAVPENLLESELFGYEKGAFTGADQMKLGKFELANESTLLLDEMSELPLQLQAKLLRVIQEGEVERLGGKYPVKVNVRILATTNKNLKQMVQRGQFREDLYYRLNVIPLEIPPLRQRTGDIEILAKHFLEQSCLNNQLAPKQFSALAMHAIRFHEWKGNVRELQNAIERVSLLSQSNTIEASELGLNIEELSARMDFGPGMTVSEAERLLIMKTLDYTAQNRTKAAELLGISIRTLRNKLNEYKGGFDEHAL